MQEIPTKNLKISHKVSTILVVVLIWLNQIVQTGTDDNRTSVHRQKLELESPLIPICNKANRITLDPFIESGLKEADYSNACGVPFVRLHRSTSANTEVILLLVQISIGDGRFKNLQKIDKFYVEDIFIVHKIVGEPGFYQIVTHKRQATPFYFQIDDDHDDNNRSYPHNGNHSENRHEIILKQNRIYNLNDTFHIEITRLDERCGEYSNNINKSDTSPLCKPVDTSQSFTVTCISIDPTSHCYPWIDTYSIVCHCAMIRERSHAAGISDRTGVILPCLIILFLLIVVYSFAMRSKIVAANTTPEEQLNLIQCTVATAVYEYNLIFRVGCATGDFDIENNYIDFEILGPNDGIIGSPVRFDLGLLPDLVCGEMHCLIGRVSPMPSIQGIRSNHSDPHNFIFFYEWVLRNLHDDSVIERRTILRYVANTPMVFRGVESSTHDNEDSGLFPELPVEDLTYVETLTLLCLTVMMIGCFAMLFENFDFGYFLSKHENGSMYRSLQDILLVAPIGLVSLMFVLFVYKYYLKRIQLRYEFSVDKFEAYFWYKVCDSFLIFMVKICIVCAVICVYFGLQISFILSAYWYCSMLLCSVLVLGLWATFNRCICMKNFYESSSFFGRGPTFQIIPPQPVYRPRRRRRRKR